MTAHDQTTTGQPTPEKTAPKSEDKTTKSTSTLKGDEVQRAVEAVVKVTDDEMMRDAM